MAWKTQRTSSNVYVDVSLDEFDRDQLLQALIDDGCLSEKEAEAISKRKSAGAAVIGVSDEDENSENLELARIYLRRRDRASALHQIEYYLGREFYGVLTQ